MKTRTELIEQISAASLAGTLGFFVGAGFSKSLTRGTAPGWGQLLQSVASDLGLADPLASPQDIVGTSFPRIATQMATALESTLPPPFSADPILRRDEAIRRLKLQVCRKASLVADPTVLTQARSLFDALEPAWLVTTNYDFLAEDCLRHPETLLPDQVLRSRRGTTPVFHIHGHIVNPTSIVITEDDYAQALHLSDYRRARLGMLFAESTTLMIGYGLGDVNVQTALHHTRAFRDISDELRPADLGHLVFVHRTPTPQSEPRRGAWGETIVDTHEILDFLQELVAARSPIAAYWEQVKQFIAAHLGQPQASLAFVNDQVWRNGFINSVRSIPAALGAGDVVRFVQGALSGVSQQATTAGGWTHYKTWLAVVLDIMELWPLGTMPPQLFEYIASELRMLSPLIDPQNRGFIIGYAQEATNLWHIRSKAIFSARPELLRALRTHAERESAYALEAILPSLS